MDEQTTLLVAGVIEVVIGLLVIVFWRHSWPIFLSLAGFATLLVSSMAIAPGHAVHAFNPITLTVSAILFCLIQIAEQKSRLEPNEYQKVAT